MPSYDCVLCNFSTKLKTDFRRHLNTKKHIKKLNELKTLEELHIEKNLPAAQFCSKNLKNEEKNLKNAKHRQDIAYAIYKAIVKFRYSREQYLSEN